LAQKEHSEHADRSLKTRRRSEESAHFHNGSARFFLTYGKNLL